MATATICEHCKTQPLAKTITTGVPGTQPVVLSLCNCDFLDCRVCTGKVRDIYARSQVCVHCR